MAEMPVEESTQDSIGKVVQVPFADHMVDKFTTYAMDVIKERALPDVRDGLKPVHRHILYAMRGLGLHPNSQYKKCARTVGETLGKYHPHSDASVYDAMIVASQDWKMKYPLIDVHGNNGSVDNDPAAAMRYTEGKLSPIGELMMADIDKNTVRFVPNYDESEQEPSVMSGLFPNLLCNPSNGIAVGMACSFVPHSAKAVYEALDKTIEYALNGEDITEDEVINTILAPDFPTGGVIINLPEVHKAYREGQGRCIVRAVYHIEPYGKRKDREAIVVTEIPYGVNKAKLVSSIGHLASEDEDFTQIHEARDESDRNGMRIVIELEKNAPANIIINRLLKRTELQKSISINHTVLIDGKPHTHTPLKTLVDKFLEHVTEVLQNKAQYERNRLEKRLHIITAYLKALEDVDATFELMKAKNRKAACDNLKEAYDFDDEQAQAVSAMHLYSFSEEDQEKLCGEYESLDNEFKRYDNILRDEMELLKYVREELAKIAERFKNEKRLTSISTETDDRDTIPDIDVVMAYTHNGYIKSVKLDEYNSQKRNGTGTSFKTKEDDFVESIKTLSTQDDLVFIGASGKAYVLPAYKVPTVSKSSIGKPLNNYIPLDNDERIIKFFVVTKEDKEDENLSLLLATKKGIGKRMLLSDLPQTRNGAKIMNLRTEDDVLVSAVLVNNDAEMLTISLKGQGLKFPVDKVSIMGRAAAGVRIMGLEDGDELVSAFTVTEEDQILQVMASGAAKRMKSSDIPAKLNRGGKGVKVLTAINRVGGVVTAGVVKETDDCIIVTKNGMVIRTPAKGISLQSRISNGVKAISLNGEDTIASVTVVDTNEENKTDE